MALAEHLLHELVRDGLVFTGKVEVDIRRLIALKAQEHLKRDQETLLAVLCPADGADLVRHVHAAGVGRAVHVEIAVAAVGANVVRLERVDLRDARHRGDERGADRTARADEVAVAVGLVHQALRHEIERGKPVADDGLELTVQSRLHDLGQVVA